MENHIFNGKIHYKWPFSVVMLVYQRVMTSITSIERIEIPKYHIAKKKEKILREAERQ